MSLCLCHNDNVIFMWHMPDYTTESGPEHSSRLHPSINLHAPVKALLVQLLWYPTYYSGGMKARVIPVQWSKSKYIALLRIWTRMAGFKIIKIKRWPLQYHCTHTGWLGNAGCWGRHTMKDDAGASPRTRVWRPVNWQLYDVMMSDVNCVIL